MTSASPPLASPAASAARGRAVLPARLLGALALAAFAAALVVPAAPATAAQLPAGFVGISPQGHSSARDYELMREAGIRNVRHPLFWSQVQAKSRLAERPDFSSFDRDVALAAENGMRVTPFLFASPSWVAAEEAMLPVRTPWQRWAWATFVRDAVSRYGPGGSFWDERDDLPYLPVRMWEIWNEQNIVSFDRDPDPVRFATLLRIAGRILHRADRGSKVIVGGFFGRPLQVPPNIATGDYMARIYEAGRVKAYFDGVGLHPYVAEASAIRAQIRNLRRVMRLHGDAATPLYLTEVGWGSNPGPTRWERGLRGQARLLSQTFSLVAAMRHRWRIGGLWWFTWADQPGTCSFCETAGVLTVDREAKPSWYRFVRWTGGNPRIVPRANPGVEPEVPAAHRR